jgi:pimeloyl-ACP methyl ester carboxylesterase
MLTLPDLPGVTHRFVALPTGVRVHVAEAGPPDAPAVLCLHGWPQHWWMWRRVMPMLADDFRLVMPDMRGFGWSDWPADGDFAKQRLAEDAEAVVDELGLGRVHLLTHDWGAWTGMLLATGDPSRVRSLLALGIVHPWQPRLRSLRNGWRFLYQVPLSAGLGGPALASRIMRAAWGDMATWDEEAVPVFAERVTARASARLYRSFMTRELPAVAAGGFDRRRLQVPTRLLIGSRDALGAHLAAGIEDHGDDASAEILRGAGHFLPEERPAEVAERARALFADA